MNADLIGNIANISLALSLIVGLVFGISQVRAAARDRRERLTLETLSYFGSREFSILVAEKMVDLDLVDETLGSFVVTTWVKFKPMALSTRREDEEPFMSEYFQWMAETIDARTKANSRPPAYESLPRRH